MKGEEDGALSRRAFAGAAGFLIVPRHVLGGAGYVPPSDRVTLAAIGMGRQGMAVTMELLARPDVQVVAVCDCNQGSKDYAEYGANALLTSARRLLGSGYENWGEDLASPGSLQLTHSFRTSLGMGGRDPARRVVEAFYSSRKASTYKGCASYRDYRELLEKEKDVDAVYVATPDHWHAPISLAAMRKRKHVLCQKPMTHSIGEARRMAQIAREMKTATSLPVSNPSSDATRFISEWIADGAIGRVREVHNWSSRPFWAQGVDRPAEQQPVPEGLDWDLWLGPAPSRPYNKAYLPFVWRGWYDFGCGSFGDMGCYSFAGLFKILDLTPPTAAEACSSESFEETYPKASIVHLDFPAKGSRAALRLSWYDGGLKPPRPAGLSQEDQQMFDRGREGIMYIGDKGILLGGFNGDNPHVYPESAKYKLPPRERGARERDRAMEQWLAAVKGGPAPLTNFEIQAPVTEAFLLGCIAQRLAGSRLEWDTGKMRVTNLEKANQYVDPPYRSGYDV
ncbi:MAG: Gfo/Idh/MocA family oxidoreductase [Bryobacteraceae bacterium]|nr:Gfo/Idh/MocA family oxidoreductase [Bryobacterales bacterium]MEB2360987.1 Gfo/Idh/MocA family oxidoreductase [Bryobacterales bacterium]NUN00933.1 Gfo/Idh/MocA family oxidoreductase [Bryobacteraceae bacterium]